MPLHRKSERIVRYEIAGFSAILLMTWTNEVLGIPQRFYERNYTTNWHDAITESIITLAVAIPTIIASWRISRRLHHLEGFLRVCSWCRKVDIDEEWVPLEEYMRRNLNTETTHGICPECLERMKNRRPSGETGAGEA